MKRAAFLLIGIACLVGARVVAIRYQKKADLEKTTLFYKIVGDGFPSILFLHGMLGSHNNWDKILPRLKDQHKLILLDLLGFADSPKPAIENSVEQHLNMIKQTLLYAEIQEKFYIVGHSMGATLALNFAIENPDRILGVILINPPMKTSEPELIQSIQESSSKVIGAMTSNQYLGRFICHLHELIPLISYPLIRLLEPELPPAVARAAGHHNFDSYQGSLKNVLIGQNFYTLIEKVKSVPILVLAAKQDKYTNSTAIDELPDMPNLKVVRIEGGHNVILKNPEQIIYEIKKFISHK